MKTNQLLIVGGIGLAAFFLISKKANASGRPAGGNRTGAGVPPAGQYRPGMPGYAANRQAAADQQQLAMIGQAGNIIGRTFDWLTRPSGSTSSGTLPSGTYSGAYGPPVPPDYSATNPPYLPMTEAQVMYGDTGYGEMWQGYQTEAQNLYSNDAYGDAWSGYQTEAQSLYSNDAYGSWN